MKKSRGRKPRWIKEVRDGGMVLFFLTNNFGMGIHTMGWIQWKPSRHNWLASSYSNWCYFSRRWQAKNWVEMQCEKVQEVKEWGWKLT